MFGGEMKAMPDSAGLFYIAELLKAPGKHFDASELRRIRQVNYVSSDNPLARRRSSVQASRNIRRDEVCEQIPDGVRPISADMGDVLDERAQQEYRRRMEQLEEEMAEARANNDEGTMSRIDREIKMLTREWKAAMRRHGRARRFSPAQKKDRDAVRVAIDRALSSLKKSHGAIWDHLHKSVTNGPVWRYTADPLPSWDF